MMKESRNIIKILSEAIDSGRDAALVTVISVAGSTPRETAAKMIVYADGSIEGTIGGGGFENLAIKQSVECIKKGKGRKFSFELTPKGIGALCMGRMEIFVDVYKNPLKVLILGAGHVGQKIYEVCHAAGYPCVVADDRTEFANRERFPHASDIILKRPDKAVRPAKPDKNTYIVIVTRGHKLDRQCLVESMKTKARYIGMIGSADKVGETFKILAKKKIYPLKDSRVHSPIGLNIGGKTPGEIAVSVLAEIIKLHYRKDGRHMKIEGRGMKDEG